MKETGALFSLPEVCLKLRKVLADSNHTWNDIAEIIMYDPALSTRILRIVNSAYYGLPNPARDIAHAVSILGEQDLNNLVIVTSIVNTMNSLETGLNLQSFWKKSVFCAVMSKNIADHFQHEDAGELFICGLLQNVGKLLIYCKEPGLHQAVEDGMKKNGRSDFEVEQEYLGFNHADVGGFMARAWNFSDLLTECVSRHHEIPESDSEIGCHHISYLAGLSTGMLDLDSNISIDFDSINITGIESLAQLNLSEEEFVSLLTTSYESYLQVFEAFCGGVS